MCVCVCVCIPYYMLYESLTTIDMNNTIHYKLDEPRNRRFRDLSHPKSLDLPDGQLQKRDAPVQEEDYFFLYLIVYYTLCKRLDGAYPCFVALWLQDLFIQILTSARNTSQKKKKKN